MVKSAYFNNCVREIRQCVYGRDNRKPIADAIERLNRGIDNGQNIIVGTPWNNMGVVVNSDIIDWIEQNMQIEYIDYLAKNSSSGNMTLSFMEKDDYRLIDSKSGDVVSLISGDDYLLTFGGTGWSNEGIERNGYFVNVYVPRYETYTLVVNV